MSEQEPPIPSPSPPAGRWKTSQVFLGVFICWQIWFLVSQNTLGLIESAQEYVADEEYVTPQARETFHLIAPDIGKDEGQGQFLDLSKGVMGYNKIWLQVTGQAQSWGLFSGGYVDSVFPAVILRWDDEDPSHYPLSAEAQTVAQALPALAATNPFEAVALSGGAPLIQRDYQIVLTSHEPVDINHYFRWRQMRMRRYENNVVITLSDDGYSDEHKRDEYWGRRIRKHLDRHEYIIKPYMKRRYEEIKPLLGDLPAPTQVVLVLRRFRTVRPEDAPPFWKGPFVVPLLSWRPPAPGAVGEGKYARYDAETHAFRSAE